MSLGILVAAAARLLDTAAVDGHDAHEHGGEDAGHDGPVHCSGADDNYIISGSLSLYLPDDDDGHADGGTPSGTSPPPRPGAAPRSGSSWSPPWPPWSSSSSLLP